MSFSTTTSSIKNIYFMIKKKKKIRKKKKKKKLYPSLSHLQTIVYYTLETIGIVALLGIIFYLVKVQLFFSVFI